MKDVMQEYIENLKNNPKPITVGDKVTFNYGACCEWSKESRHAYLDDKMGWERWLNKLLNIRHRILFVENIEPFRESFKKETKLAKCRTPDFDYIYIPVFALTRLDK